MARIAIIPAGAVGDWRLGAYDVRVLAAFGAHVTALDEPGEVTDEQLLDEVEGSFESHRKVIANLVSCGWLRVESATATGVSIGFGVADLRYRFWLLDALPPVDSGE